MSSKSRQKPQPRKQPSSAAGTTGAAGAAPAKKDEHEELIHAPRQTSKLRFVVTLVIVVVLLVIFIIPQALFGACRPNPLSERKLAWEHPTRGHVEVTFGEFNNQRILWATLLEFISGDRRLTLSDEQIAQLIVLDGVAEASGVAASDAELIQMVTAFVGGRFGGDTRAYQDYIRGRRVSVREFEETLRRFLRQQIYRRWFTYLGQQPSTHAVEALWHESHREYRYQVAQLDLATLRDEVAADAPQTDEELLAWVEELPAGRKAAFQVPERAAVEQVRLTWGDDLDGTALLATWPAAEGTDPEAQARAYHGLMSGTRFANPFPENPTPESIQSWVQTKPFEEVADQARAEAPLYFALEAWHADLLARREAGEEIDLAAEAAALGLAHDASGLLSHEELRDRETWGGMQLAGRVRGMQAGALSAKVIAEKDALVIARVTERAPAETKPIGEIRDEAVEAWVDDHVGDAGLAKLAELRATFVPESDEAVPSGPATVDAAGFEAAAEAAGLEVVTTDWIDRGARFTQMPSFGPDAPLEDVLGRRPELFELELEQVSEPFLDEEGGVASLARDAGEREADIARMTPLEFERLQNRAASDAVQYLRCTALGELPQPSFGQRSIVPEIDVDALRARFGLQLVQPKDEPDDEPEE